MKRFLITGGAGFIGTNLADRLLSAGRPVRILDDLSRPGVTRNVDWLQARHGSLMDADVGDVRDVEHVRRALDGVTGVFHLAAQVAVTTSLDEPLTDAGVNIQGTLNLLEAARTRPRPPAIVFTSTNKVYGSLPDVALREAESRYEPVDDGVRQRGISESRALSFRTPYGCSKGAADQYVLDYHLSFGLPTVVLRMSCIYGPHQMGTEDQGWVAHFMRRALRSRAITIYGDGKQVRDILFVDDLVDAQLLAMDLAPELSGHAFNIGGGPRNAVSLRELIAAIAELRGGKDPALRMQPWREGDQRYYVSDTSLFRKATGWRPVTSPREGLGRLHDWLVSDSAGGLALAGEAAA